MEITILIPLLIVFVIMQFGFCVLGLALTLTTMKVARKNVDMVTDTRLDHRDVTEQYIIMLYVQEKFRQETRITSLFFWKVWILHSVPYLWIWDMKRYGRHLSFWSRSSDNRVIYPYIMKVLNFAHGNSN